jgi:hypothetical protein
MRRGTHAVRISFRSIGGLVALAYFYGAILGVFALAWDIVFRDGPPKWAWWQFLLAPLAIGFFAMGGEWIVEKVQSSTGFGQSGVSPSRHALHLVILFVVLALLIIGPAMYKVARP